MGTCLDLQRPSRDLRVALQRRRSLAGGDCDGATVGLEPGAVLHGARAGDRARYRFRRVDRGAGDQRLSARVQRRLTTDRRQGQAQRSRQFHQQGERLARNAEEARERHRQRGGKGVGRRRPRRSLGFRSGRARLLRCLPDALRPDRRTALAGLDRKPPVSGQAEAVPASHGSDHPHDLALHARKLGDLCDLRDGLRRHCVGARPPVPARPGGHRGDPRPHPQRRRDDRRHHRRTRRAVGQPPSLDRLCDRDGGLPADRELHPAADDHR